MPTGCDRGAEGAVNGRRFFWLFGKQWKGNAYCVSLKVITKDWDDSNQH